MCLVHRGIFGTSGDTMSTSGDIMSTSGGCSVHQGDVQYIGGYHEYIGGYHEYIGGFRPQIETEGSAKIEKAILCFFWHQNIERQQSLQKITAKSS